MVFSPARLPNHYAKPVRLTPTRSSAIWIALMAAAGAVAVILAWRVPEPSAPRPGPVHQVAPISFTTCTEQAPPNYGTRALGNVVEAGGCTR